MTRRLASSCFVALVAALAGEAHAQSGPWPTLRDAGLEYISGSGALQLTLSGQLDLESLHLSDSWVGLASRTAGESPIDESRVRCTRCHSGMGFPGEGGVVGTYRLRVFADLFLGDHVYALVEARSDRGHSPSDGSPEARIEQAYTRVVADDGRVGVQAGRFVTPFGSYPLRHLTTSDPFVRPPLAYDYRTLMSRTLVPVDTDILLDWRHAIEFLRRPGTPPVWDVPYQWGAMAFGSLGPLDLRVAAMNGVPSSPPSEWGFDWEDFRDPSWVVGARLRLSAELEVGASWTRGSWLGEIVAGQIRPDSTAPAEAEPPDPDEFYQRLYSIDLSFARGSTTTRAEVIADRWEVPNVADAPREVIYNLEVQRDVLAGLWLAGRIGFIDFRPLKEDPGRPWRFPGGRADWDYDVWRVEAAVGYRLTTNAGVVLSVLDQHRDAPSPPRIEQGAEGDERATALGLRLWWAF